MSASLPHPGNLGGRHGVALKEESLVDVRIGITQTPKELEVELDDSDRNAVLASIEAALAGEQTLRLEDRRGRTVLVPVAKVAYVEVGASTAERRVGFGAA